MANHTTNYNLIKPLGTENYDVENDNSNMDIIDAQLKTNADNITTKANDSDLTNLAGEGRTTETVKGNAYAIANLTEEFNKNKVETAKQFINMKRKLRMGGMF
ncbi:hypothetical protein [Clostridium kluyveri]|uniref:hypothetical protein n=1 Tax=Clostridium kluyveri TaxID=1534 RepID=UPI002246EFCF|nr:hypothetical protein [Clostridium kluyveri]UZQ49871.1 hypothetical protein OP486_18275 [Clostridium kluyveri]